VCGSRRRRGHVSFGTVVALDAGRLRMAPHQHGASENAPTLQNFAALFATWVPLLFGCWLIFVATFSKPELIVGSVVALLGGVALCVIERADDSHFRPRLRNWAEVIWVPWLVVRGTYEILVVSIRDLFGGKKAVSAFRITRFDAGESGDVHDTGRRVLAVLYTTTTPNTIVLGINISERVLVFHEIDHSAVSMMTRSLGAIAP